MSVGSESRLSANARKFNIDSRAHAVTPKFNLRVTRAPALQPAISTNGVAVVMSIVRTHAPTISSTARRRPLRPSTFVFLATGLGAPLGVVHATL